MILGNIYYKYGFLYMFRKTFYCFFAGLVNFMLIIMFQCKQCRKWIVHYSSLSPCYALFWVFQIGALIRSITPSSTTCVYICIKFEEFTPASCPECNLMRRWVNKQNPQNWKVHHCQKPSHEKILNVSVIYQLREPGDIYLHPLPWTWYIQHCSN